MDAYRNINTTEIVNDFTWIMTFGNTADVLNLTLLCPQFNWPYCIGIQCLCHFLNWMRYNA